MPADVRAWLEHLERIERKKNELHGKAVDEVLLTTSILQGAGGLGSIEDVDTITNPDAGMVDRRGDVTDMTARLTKPFSDLKEEFLTTGPPCPRECGPIPK